MKDSIRNKLEKLVERHEEVGALLSDPDVIGNNDKFRELSMEYSKLEPVVTRYREYQGLLAERTNAQEMMDGEDALSALGVRVNERRKFEREGYDVFTAWSGVNRL